MRFKTLMLATVSSLAMTGIAFSADMPMKAAPVMAPSYNWTGFYLGGSLAAGIYNVEVDPNDVAADAGDAGFTSKKSKLAWGGGVQGGYNWQMRRAVFGVEADYTYLSANASHVTGFIDDCGACTPITAKTSGLITLRGRFGYDLDGLLIYGTAGIGWLKANYNYNVLDSSSPKGGNFASNKWQAAFVAGGGVEYMLNRNWSVKAEVLWVKPETVTAVALDTHNFTPGTTVKYDADLYLSKFGVNYHF